MDEAERDSAARMRALVERGRWTPALFRAALEAVPALARDAWVDATLGLDGIPEDGALPRGCVPYLPCAVDALLRLVEQAPVRAGDVFVDVGSGLGRAAVVVHLLTGAPVLGVEIQPALVDAARALAARLGLRDVSFLPGDAAEIVATLPAGTVFFLYCPFGGDRLGKVLADLEAIARTRPLRLCCLDLPLPPCRWLEPVPPLSRDLAIYRSVRSVPGGPRC